MSELELVDVIKALRTQLDKSIEQADRDGAKFQLQQAEVELALTVSRENKGKLGVKVGFLGANAEVEGGRSGGHQSVHRIKLLLTPLTTTNVSGQRGYDPTKGVEEEQ